MYVWFEGVVSSNNFWGWAPSGVGLISINHNTILLRPNPILSLMCKSQSSIKTKIPPLTLTKAPPLSPLPRTPKNSPASKPPVPPSPIAPQPPPIKRILRSVPPIKSSLTMSRIRRIKIHFPSSLLPSTLLLLLLNSQRIQ